MKREHLIIVAILALILYFLMKHSKDCNCASCFGGNLGNTGNMPAHIRTADNEGVMPGHIRMRREELPFGHIRHSDKYIGSGQHIKQHLRYDNRNGMFNGMFSGSP